MSASIEQVYVKQFIKSVRDKVLDLYKCIPENKIKPFGETDTFIILISEGMKLLWRVDWMEEKLLGNFRVFHELSIDSGDALHLIENELLPRLVEAEKVPMPAGTSDTARGILAGLVQVIQSRFSAEPTKDDRMQKLLAELREVIRKYE
jgi:hypothetical protein